MTESITKPDQQQNELKKELVKKAEEIAKSAPKYKMKYTLDGTVLVEPDGEGGFKEIPCPIKKDVDVPSLKTPQEVDMMFVIYTAVTDLKTNPKLKKRAIPLTRNEVLNPQIRGGITDMGFTKSTLKSLEKKNLIKVDIIKLVDTKLNKTTGARTVVFFTQKGRDYVRKRINPEYRAGFEILGDEQVVEGS